MTEQELTQRYIDEYNCYRQSVDAKERFQVRMLKLFAVLMCIVAVINIANFIAVLVRR
jgi:hypothetical protein